MFERHVPRIRARKELAKARLWRDSDFCPHTVSVWGKFSSNGGSQRGFAQTKNMWRDCP